jgi:hypothetical protein
MHGMLFITDMTTQVETVIGWLADLVAPAIRE